MTTWQQAANEKLSHFGHWLQRRKGQEAPHLLYGTLCGLSLWPLVEAAQSGQILPATIALGGVAGGVGGNLIAEQVQRWKDRADDDEEVVSQIADWVTENAAADSELRGALDAILQKLDAIPQAQTSLSNADRQWFSERLGEELSQLGNLTHFEAILIGGGAVAQGQGAKAADRGAVVTDTIQNAIVMTGGTYVEKQVVEEQPSPDSADLRAAYLNRLFQATSALSLAGVDPKAATDAQARLNLGAVYTALLTLSTEAHERMARGEMPDREAKRLSALDQLNTHPRLVLLGDPGSGKSTFVNFVAMCLAGEVSGQEEANLALLTAPLPDDEGDDQEERQSWDHGPLLPVRIVLRDFAARGLPAANERATAKHLRDFIEADLESAALGDYSGHLAKELLEQGGLLLLDGLDEVPEADSRRQQIKQAVEDFAAAFPRCRVLVTGRTYAYQKQDWRLPGFAEAVLAPFSPGQIRRFVDGWYAHTAALRGMHADDAQGRAELLKRAVFGSNRLSALARGPLLLTLMASLHAWRGGSLPEQREEMYADAVDLLFDWWESPKVVRDAKGEVKVVQPSLAEWLKVDDRQKVRDLLNELAYQAHATQPDLAGTADVPEGKLVSGLMHLSQNPGANPARLVEFLSQRAGLLLPRGVGVYAFPHRTFQEYLAACYLTDHDYPDKVANLAREKPDRWREVALLAGAKAARGSDFALWALVEALCCREPEAEAVSLADTWGAHLAGQALAETADLERVSERDRAKVALVQRWLAHILKSGALPAVERAAVGDTLAKLGDPRPGVGVAEQTGLPEIEWCYVPSGSFVMGSQDDPMAFGDEQPQHLGDIEYGYWMARYPVTNDQFRAFVDDPGGYQADEWWTSAGLDWREDRSGPRDYGEPFNLPNHPVVGVTWYEAVAFTGWLTRRYREAGLLPELWGVRSPSEVEWEKAARGGMKVPPEPIISCQVSALDEQGLVDNPDPRRRYPWGDDPDPDRANYRDTGIGTTSAVGCFPGGASPYGVLDMSGNVWEWCATKWQDSYREYRDDNDPEGDDPRVLRGGAFFGLGSVRCASRVRISPYYRYYYGGFRIVVAPGFQ